MCQPSHPGTHQGIITPSQRQSSCGAGVIACPVPVAYPELSCPWPLMRDLHGSPLSRYVATPGAVLREPSHPVRAHKVSLAHTPDRPPSYPLFWFKADNQPRGRDYSPATQAAEPCCERICSAGRPQAPADPRSPGTACWRSLGRCWARCRPRHVWSECGGSGRVPGRR